MADISEYELELPYGMTHTVLLSAEDAEKYGDKAKPVGAKKASAPADKSRRAADK